MNLLNNIYKFFKLPFSEQILFFYALALGNWFFLNTKFLPAKYFLNLLKSAENNSEVNEILLNKAITTIRRLRKLSGIYDNCLVKSLTLKYLLKAFRINSNVVLCVRYSSGRMFYAHAYLEIDKDYIFFKPSKFTNIF